MAPPEHWALPEILAVLETSPPRIAAAATGVSDDALHEPLEPGGWSARDILAHIRACDRTWGGYIGRILDEDHPTFRQESPRGTIRRTDFLTLPFRVSLDGFTASRALLVGRVRAAATEGLSRVATVKIPSRGAEELTALHYAQRITEHERDHVEHLERTLAALR